MMKQMLHQIIAAAQLVYRMRLHLQGNYQFPIVAQALQYYPQYWTEERSSCIGSENIR
jgi:hypothetical protein